jgi:hypothetical protein
MEKEEAGRELMAAIARTKEAGAQRLSSSYLAALDQKTA